MHDHIQYLLYRHNCVVLPGFGGIVLQYSPARIHPAQHIFQPPRKALAFNRSLTTNDGLLISHVANAEQLHYDDAETKVRRFVDQMEESIRRKGDFALPGIGRFHNDVEGNLQFEPEESENYLLNAYGLDKFVSPAIVRRDAFEPNPAAQEMKKKKRRFNWFGLSIVFLVAAFVGVQILSINNLTSLVTKPLAGFMFDTSFQDSSDIGSRDTEVIAPAKRDTIVQIIVIKDESALANFDTTAFTAGSVMVTAEPSHTAPDAAPVANAGDLAVALSEATSTKPLREKLSYADSLKLIETSKVPMRGEYNPSQTGRFVIVFANSMDSAKADYYQRQLWRDRIGARVMPYRNRLIVAKQGYMTAKAAAKDLAIYRLLGYNEAYILKTKEEQPTAAPLSASAQ